MHQSFDRITAATTTTATIEGVVNQNSPAVGCQIADLDLLRGTIIVSILRAGTFLFPTPEQTLQPGDTVTVLSRPADVTEVQKRLDLILPAANAS